MYVQRRVRVTIMAVEEQKALHIRTVCLLPYLSSAESSCAVLSSVACRVLPYFFTLSQKRHDLREKKLLNIKSVFIFYTLV
jgi:hypothetical protein